MKVSNIFCVLFTVLGHLASTVRAVSSGECSSAASYYCPNCGGMQVSDCLECDGFLSTDTKNKICFERKLFQPKNTDTADSENYYRYLWNDLLGSVVWFVTAGISMACGVGGGGIYVPLGMLLLQFAPKAASGLSQASIFGASIGGLILNSRDVHPFKMIRHEAAQAPTEEVKLGRQRELSKEEEQRYKAAGGVFYSRPLIDFDMALFLSPMAMAGAVLGVLVQKILPNWLYLLIAGLVLSLTSHKTYKKFFSAYAKEKKAREDAAKEEENCNKTIHDSRADSEQPEERNSEGATEREQAQVSDKDTEESFSKKICVSIPSKKSWDCSSSGLAYFCSLS